MLVEVLLIKVLSSFCPGSPPLPTSSLASYMWLCRPEAIWETCDLITFKLKYSVVFHRSGV